MVLLSVEHCTCTPLCWQHSSAWKHQYVQRRHSEAGLFSRDRSLSRQCTALLKDCCCCGGAAAVVVLLLVLLLVAKAATYRQYLVIFELVQKLITWETTPNIGSEVYPDQG